MPLEAKPITLLPYALALLCLATLQARADIIWRMATEYPETNISGLGLATFKRLVTERTHGLVTTENAFDNILKITSGAMVRAAEEHRIDGGDAFAGPLEATDPIYGMPSLPFIVQSVEAARALNANARPLYAQALAGHGLKLLYLTLWPSTGIWSQRALLTRADLQTLAIRTYDTSSTEVMRSVGAKAEFLPFNHAIARIKDHSLNAILTSGDGGAGRTLWDDLHHFAPINYAIPISIAFVRQDDFDALPAAIQDQVTTAAAETERLQFARLAERTAENYKQMRANGVSIDDPVPTEIIHALKDGAAAPIAAWRAKVSARASEILEQCRLLVTCSR